MKEYRTLLWDIGQKVKQEVRSGRGSKLIASLLSDPVKLVFINNSPQRCGVVSPTPTKVTSTNNLLSHQTILSLKYSFY